jgi:hypothetical protein
LATAVFLQIQGVEISRAGNDDVNDLVIDVAAGRPTVDTIATRFRQLATYRTHGSPAPRRAGCATSAHVVRPILPCASPPAQPPIRHSFDGITWQLVDAPPTWSVVFDFGARGLAEATILDGTDKLIAVGVHGTMEPYVGVIEPTTEIWVSS